MPLFYCFNCGFGTSYSLNKPKVCLKCNQSFSRPADIITNTASRTSTLKTPIASIVINDDNDDTSEEVPFVSLDSFASIDNQSVVKSFTFSPAPQQQFTQPRAAKRGRPRSK